MYIFALTHMHPGKDYMFYISIHINWIGETKISKWMAVYKLVYYYFSQSYTTCKMHIIECM